MNVNKLGNQLVLCNLNCEGINNNPRKGIIPRCLILEEKERYGKKKCIVVGLNPGKCKPHERQYYLEHGLSYKSIKTYFSDTNLKNRNYFKKTRDLIAILGYDGSILWTDLVKCECFGKNGKIPIQTLRICINKFLRKEIELFKSTTIFALGNDAFNFCALSFPNHFIIGLPHPASRGNFSKLKKKIFTNPKFYINKLLNKKDKYGNYIALYLKSIGNS